jgi:HK97 family phage portal protein
MLFRKKKKEPDKTTLEIFQIELERKARERAYGIKKSSYSGMTGEELLAAAIAGDDDLLLTGGRKRITEFKSDKSFIEKYEAVVWVYICVNKNAENIAGVPLIIVDPETQEQIDHPFQAILNQPNQDLNQHELLERTLINLETSGKALWELQKNKLGAITSMYVLDSWRVKAVPTKKRENKEIEKFNYTTDEKDSTGKQKVIPFLPEDVVYFRYFNPLKPHDGLSPITSAKMHIQSDLYATNWNKTFFEEDTQPHGILTTEKVLMEDEAEWILAQYEQKRKGKPHRVVVLPIGLKYENTTISHSDMDFLNQQRNVRNIVAAIYGVPLPVIGFYDSETASSRSAGIQEYMTRYWTQTLIPKMRKIITGLNESLGKQFDPMINFAFDLDAIEALQGNQLEQAKTAKMMVGTGLSWNEIRRKAYDIDEIPGMDWVPVQANIVPAGDTSLINESTESESTENESAELSISNIMSTKKKLLTAKTGYSG